MEFRENLVFRKTKEFINLESIELCKKKEKMEFQGKVAQSIALFVLILLSSTLFYSNVEGWRYIDSVYFSVATVTTVGYGDFVPQTDAGKIFTMIFSFMGIGFALYFFTMFGKQMYKKQLISRLKDLDKLNASSGVKVLKK